VKFLRPVHHPAHEKKFIEFYYRMVDVLYQPFIYTTLHYRVYYTPGSPTIVSAEIAA
jgi:hypothetical protein